MVTGKCAAGRQLIDDGPFKDPCQRPAFEQIAMHDRNGMSVIDVCAMHLEYLVLLGVAKHEEG